MTKLTIYTYVQAEVDQFPDVDRDRRTTVSLSVDCSYQPWVRRDGFVSRFYGSGLRISNDITRTPRSTRTTKKRDYAIGIGYILVVTLLWTLGSFVTQVNMSRILSRPVMQHLLYNSLIYMEVATINHSCMSESSNFCRISQIKISGLAVWIRVCTRCA